MEVYYPNEGIEAHEGSTRTFRMLARAYVRKRDTVDGSYSTVVESHPQTYTSARALSLREFHSRVIWRNHRRMRGQ